MKLLLIHGRKQGGKDEEGLKSSWLACLKTGLAKSNLDLPVGGEDVHLPFYGRLLDDLTVANIVQMKGLLDPFAESVLEYDGFAEELLTELAVGAGASAEEMAEIQQMKTMKGAEKWGFIRALLRLIDARTGWGQLAIKKFTSDVYKYLKVSEVRAAVDNTVLKGIPEEPCLAVAHSLGSIVLYNILCNNPELNVRGLVTVGSPLGIRAVQHHLAKPLVMPKPLTGGWLNAYDKRDIVALNPLDKKRFDVTPAIENLSHVRNGSTNRHRIIGYLGDRIVAERIYRKLTNT